MRILNRSAALRGAAGLVLAFSVWTIAAAQDKPDTSKQKVVEGVISVLQRETNQFVLTTAEGVKYIFQVPTDAKFKLQDKDTKWANIENGMKAAVTYEPNDGHYLVSLIAASPGTRTATGDKPKEPEPDVVSLTAKGKVADVSSDLKSMTLKTLDDKEITFVIEDDMRYRLKNDKTTVSNFGKGSEVTALYIFKDGVNKLVGLRDLVDNQPGTTTPPPPDKVVPNSNNKNVRTNVSPGTVNNPGTTDNGVGAGGYPFLGGNPGFAFPGGANGATSQVLAGKIVRVRGDMVILAASAFNQAGAGNQGGVNPGGVVQPNVPAGPNTPTTPPTNPNPRNPTNPPTNPTPPTSPNPPPNPTPTPNPPTPDNPPFKTPPIDPRFPGVRNQGGTGNASGQATGGTGQGAGAGIVRGDQPGNPGPGNPGPGNPGPGNPNPGFPGGTGGLGGFGGEFFVLMPQQSREPLYVNQQTRVQLNNQVGRFNDLQAGMEVRLNVQLQGGVKLVTTVTASAGVVNNNNPNPNQGSPPVPGRQGAVQSPAGAGAGNQPAGPADSVAGRILRNKGDLLIVMTFQGDFHVVMMTSSADPIIIDQGTRFQVNGRDGQMNTLQPGMDALVLYELAATNVRRAVAVSASNGFSFPFGGMDGQGQIPGFVGGQFPAGNGQAPAAGQGQGQKPAGNGQPQNNNQNNNGKTGQGQKTGSGQ